jgi:hypothetical protein
VLFDSTDHDYHVGGQVERLIGAPSAWPEALHESFEPGTGGLLGFRDSWSVGNGASRRVMTLSTLVPTAIGPSLLPIVFPDDLGFTLDAAYDTSVAYLDFEGTPQVRAAEQVALVPCRDQSPLTESHLLQSRTAARNGVELDIGFYWPPAPTGAVAGYTAPLDRWTATTITGIGVTATHLEGYFSQTYRPEHHNFTEGFLFDPHLEEGIAPGVLDAWDAAGIQVLVVPAGFDAPPFMALTPDGQLVALSPAVAP